jgi:hypothetical protein
MSALEKATKVYLDEIPELHKALREFCTNLDLDAYGSGCDNWIDELECRRRDGFIPHSYNRGGFDVYNTLDCVYDDAADEQDDGDIQFHGFRIMYEGSNDGIHTICAYYSQWADSDMYGMHRAPTIAEIEINFTNSAELIEQLTAFTDKYVRGDK